MLIHSLSLPFTASSERVHTLRGYPVESALLLPSLTVGAETEPAVFSVFLRPDVRPDC
jgi:hypothetical protein